MDRTMGTPLAATPALGRVVQAVGTAEMERSIALVRSASPANVQPHLPSVQTVCAIRPLLVSTLDLESEFGYSQVCRSTTADFPSLLQHLRVLRKQFRLLW